MLDTGKMKTDSYNFPIRQFFHYNKVGQLSGAGVGDRMIVEYGVVLRVEFIAADQVKGPVRDIYFKIFKRGTCGLSSVGAVFGLPTLDVPSMTTLKGDGLGWINKEEGAYYSTLGVTLPRLDLQKKRDYERRTKQYVSTQGQVLIANEEESLSLIHI